MTAFIVVAIPKKEPIQANKMYLAGTGTLYEDKAMAIPIFNMVDAQTIQHMMAPHHLDYDLYVEQRT